MLSQSDLQSQSPSPKIPPKNLPLSNKTYLKNRHTSVLDRVNSRDYLEVNKLDEEDHHKPVRSNGDSLEEGYEGSHTQNRKNGSKLSSKDVYELTEPRIDHYLELHEGGSLVRIKPTEVNPLKSSYEVDNDVRGTKTEIKTFTPKSRRTLLKKLSVIDQNRIPQDQVLFLTLTIDGKRSPSQCKKYLNNFLTQLRQRLDGHRWFYVWKGEFHKKSRGGEGQLHFHLVLFGLRSLSHKWIRHTWSRITLGYKEYKRRCDSSDDKKEIFKSLVVTEIEPSRSWGQTKDYFSKTLGYVSKNGQEEQELIKKFNKEDRVGRFWGIGRGEVYRSFISRICFNITDEEWGKLRRVFINCVKSQWLRKHKGNFNWVKWKEYERYLKSGYRVIEYKTCSVGIWKLEPEVWLFIENEMMSRLLTCLFPDQEDRPFTKVDTQVSFKEWVNTKEEPFPIGITV